MDAWEAYAVDAAEEQGDQPAEDAISKGLESLADSASQWLAPGVEKAAAAAKDRAKLFDLNALQANDPLFAAGEQPAAPAAEPDAAPTTNDDAHARELVFLLPVGFFRREHFIWIFCFVSTPPNT